jgi:hypothetical protein
MPPILTKKLAGLPTWAWLLLATGGVGVGLYLRSRNGESGEGSTDPCDPEGENYDPEKCNAVSETQLNAGFDSGDPCDPTSVTYDPAACQATAGIGYQSAGGGGGPSGYEVYPEYPTAQELQSAEEGGVVPNAPLVTITQNIRSASKPCNKKVKPKDKKGYHVVCADGHWSFEPTTHAGKKKRHKHTHGLTGGGPPHKRGNKTAGHGKHKHHRRKHARH